MRVINKKEVVTLPLQINCFGCETYRTRQREPTLDNLPLIAQCDEFKAAYQLVTGRFIKSNSPHRCPYFVDANVNELGTGKNTGEKDKYWYQKRMAKHNGLEEIP